MSFGKSLADVAGAAGRDGAPETAALLAFVAGRFTAGGVATDAERPGAGSGGEDSDDAGASTRAGVDGAGALDAAACADGAAAAGVADPCRNNNPAPATAITATPPMIHGVGHRCAGGGLFVGTVRDRGSGRSLGTSTAVSRSASRIAAAEG